VLFDPETAKEDLVESDPLNRVDFGNATFLAATDELVATSYEDERTRVYFRDKALEADYRLLQQKLPGKDLAIRLVDVGRPARLITPPADTDPGSRYLFDRRTKKLTLEYRCATAAARAHGGDEGDPLQVLGRLEIPAFLTLPKGVAAKPCR